MNTPVNALRGRSLRSRRMRDGLPWLASALVMLWLLTWGLTAYRLREQVLINGLNTADIQARSFEDYLTQSLRTIELSASNFEIRLHTTAPPADSIHANLLEAVRAAPYLRSLSIADGRGHIVASSNPRNTGQSVDLGRYFPQAGHEAEVLRVGPIMRGRDWDSRVPERPEPEVDATPAFAPVLYPLTVASPASAPMWLVAALNPDQFVTHAQQLQNHAQGRTLWFRYDGMELWSSGDSHLDDGTPAFVRELANGLEKAEFGQRSRSLLTGHEVLSAYRVSTRYPLGVLVDLDQDSVLSAWRAETRQRAIVVLPGAAFLLVLALAYSRRRRAFQEKEQALAEQKELAARVFESSSDAILITTPDARIVSVNPAFVTLTGYAPEDALDKNPRLLSSGQHTPEFYAEMWNTLHQHDRWKGRITNRRKGGSLFQAAMTINAIRDGAGHLHHYAAVMEDITAQAAAERDQHDTLQRLELVLKGGHLGYWDWHIPSNQVVVNERLMDIMGLAMNEVPLTIESWRDRVHPQEAGLVQSLFQRHLAGHSPFFRCEIRMRHKSGEWVWVQVMGQIVERSASDQPLRMVGTHADISERHSAQERLQLAASVFDHAQEAILVTTPQAVIIEVNTAFTRITGYERQDAVGQHARLLSSGHQSREFYADMWAQLTSHGNWSGEIWNRRKSGEVYASMLTISAVRDDKGHLLRYVALFSDISQQKEHERKLERIAHFDALTGLPNRVLLSDRLLQVMSNVRRRHRCVGVVFLDLDGFKAVNDRHGHAAGDQLLVVLAQRLSQSLRVGDTLARLGGDEFVAVLQDLESPKDSLPVLERLRQAAAAPLTVNGAELQVSASLGVSFYPQAEDVGADQLLRQADQAMYQAKLGGKNQYHVFDDRQDRQLRDRHEDMLAIREALTRQEFELHYQPKVNMHTGQVVGVEALIRWNHPVKGQLPPMDFLPGIESAELVVAVGEWVLTTALQQMAAWQMQGLHLPVSVNVDGQQLQHPDFMARFQALLAEHPQIRPADLQLEVLETTALEDMNQVSEVMRACRDIGVGFALDDFGTGYSSLTYLKRLPAQDLKIDQSFIRDMLDDAEDLAILQGVLGLATAFQRGVVAEGIETVAHGQMLLRMGCQLGQGFAIAHPMAGADMPAWLAQWQPDPLWRSQRPVQPQALPLLYATAEHRAWVKAVCSCIASPGTAPPPLSSQACRFGRALEKMRPRLQPKHAAALAQVDRSHEALHRIAQSLLAPDTQAHGKQTGAPAAASVSGLLATSDRLQAELMVLAESLQDDPTAGSMGR